MKGLTELKKVEIISLGEALVDRLGPLGGDSFEEKLSEDYLGGAPANVACALANLGINVAFISRLGSDKIGQSFLDLLSSRNINLQGLQFDLTLPSRTVLVKRDPNGDRSFHGFAGNNENAFSDQMLNLSELQSIWSSISLNAKWLVVGTIPLANEISSETYLWTIDMALKQGIKIALDINWRPKFWDLNLPPSSGPNKSMLKTIFPVLMKASLLKLSYEEAIWFFDTSNPLEISMRFQKKPDVIVTNGANAINWCFEGFVGKTLPISGIPVFDTTGAGDAFISGLLYQLFIKKTQTSLLKDFEKMVEFASCCGAIVCQSAGAIDPQPTLKEVNLFQSTFFN